MFFLAPTTTRQIILEVCTPTPEPQPCVCEDLRKFESDVYTITCIADENNELTTGSVCTYKCKNSKTFLIVLKLLTCFKENFKNICRMKKIQTNAIIFH